MNQNGQFGACFVGLSEAILGPLFGDKAMKVNLHLLFTNVFSSTILNRLKNSSAKYHLTGVQL
jgi:hypothetical protein